MVRQGELEDLQGEVVVLVVEEVLVVEGVLVEPLVQLLLGLLERLDSGPCAPFLASWAVPAPPLWVHSVRATPHPYPDIPEPVISLQRTARPPPYC